MMESYTPSEIIIISLSGLRYAKEQYYAKIEKYCHDYNIPNAQFEEATQKIISFFDLLLKLLEPTLYFPLDVTAALHKGVAKALLEDAQSFDPTDLLFGPEHLNKAMIFSILPSTN